MRLFIPLLLAVTLLLADLTKVSAQDSFCVKYAKALFGGTSTRNNNYRLIQAVVARTVIGCNNDMPNAYGVPGVSGTDYDAFKPSACGGGITKVPGLVEDPLNAPFFTGNVTAYTSLSNGFQLNQFANVTQTGFPGIRFVSVSGHDVTPYPATLGGNVATNQPAEGLVTHLVTFFGKALGCDYDANADTVTSPITNAYIGRYNGATDMTRVHKDMKITQAVWDEFVSTFNLTLRSFGVNQTDIDSTVVPIIKGFLRGPTGVSTTICNQADCACAPMYVMSNGACVVPTASSSSSSTGGNKGGSANMIEASPFIMVIAMVMAIMGMIHA